MTYTIVVTDSIDRVCAVEIDADNEEDAIKEATDMWDNGDLEDEMEDCDSGPTFVNASASY